MNNKIVRGALTFTLIAGRYTCDQLAGVAETFIAMHGEEELTKVIATHLAWMRENCQKRYENREEFAATSESERKRMGGEIFDAVRASISTEGMSAFQTFIFWLSTWWFYHPVLRAEVIIVTDKVLNEAQKLIENLLIPALPLQVREATSGMELVNVAVTGEHFALLFDGEGVRRIVTDTQLFELHGAYGYIYLDLLRTGEPFVRFCCNHGGGRAFFDGMYLMSDSNFRTCAPKMVSLNHGYMVNSTRVTIINGQLFELVDDRDKLACATGAFLRMTSFNTRDQLVSFELAEASARRAQIMEGGSVLVDGVEILPIGTFLPSETQLLDTGFTLYEWSTFVPGAKPR